MPEGQTFTDVQPIQQSFTNVTPIGEQESTPAPTQVPNARIRNLPNPAEGMSPGRALYEGAKTGLMVGSIPAAAASPMSAARALAGGTVGSLVGSGVANSLGAGEFGQEVSGDIGGLVGGGLTEGTYNLAKSIIAEKLMTPTGELTSLGKALAHPAEKGGEYAIKRIFGIDPDQQEAHNIFAEKLAALEKQRQQELSQFGRLKTLDERQQARASKLNKPDPFAGMTSTATPIGNAQLPQPVPTGKPSLFEQSKAQFVSKFEQPKVDPAVAEAQDLLTRTKKLVAPGEPPTAADLKRAGDLTQVPLQKLQILAKFGDELAKNEIIRRLKQ